MRQVLITIILSLATAAQADSNVQCNENGAVVELTDGTILYFGKSCDAARKGGGVGKWWTTASAFAYEIDGESKLLPFEIDCSLPSCWAED